MPLQDENLLEDGASILGCPESPCTHHSNWQSPSKALARLYASLTCCDVPSAFQSAPGEVTDFLSFYTLPSTIMNHPTHKSLKAAYSFYNVHTKTPLIDLMSDALILAKSVRDGRDVVAPWDTGQLTRSSPGNSLGSSLQAGHPWVCGKGLFPGQ